MRILFALLLLGASGFAGAQSLVNCAPATPCSSTTGPADTGTGDAAWKAYGKINEDLNGGTINSTNLGNSATTTALASAPTKCGAGVATIGVDASGNAQGCFTPGGSGTVTTTSSPAQYQISVMSGATSISGVGPGVGGQVLTSNGPGVYPSFQSGIDLSGLTTYSSPLSADLVVAYSTANGADRGITLSNLFTALPTIQIAGGGTGLTGTPSNGQLPIGNGSGYTLATITAGSNITVTNGAGTISIASTGGAGGSAKQVLQYGASSQSQNTTAYMGSNGAQATADNGDLIFLAGTLKNLYVRTANTPASGQTFTFTVCTGTLGSTGCTGVGAAITCQETNAGNTCTDLSDTVTLTAGQAAQIKMVTSSTSGTTGIVSVAMEFDPS